MTPKKTMNKKENTHSYFSACMYQLKDCRLVLHYEQGMRLYENGGDIDKVDESLLIWTHSYDDIKSTGDDGQRFFWVDFGTEEGEIVSQLHISIESDCFCAGIGPARLSKTGRLHSALISVGESRSHWRLCIGEVKSESDIVMYLCGAKRCICENCLIPKSFCSAMNFFRGAENCEIRACVQSISHSCMLSTYFSHPPLSVRFMKRIKSLRRFRVALHLCRTNTPTPRRTSKTQGRCDDYSICYCWQLWNTCVCLEEVRLFSFLAVLR